LIAFVLSFLFLISFFILAYKFLLLVKFLFELYLFLLFLFDMCILNGLDNFIKLFILSLFHFT